MHHTTNHYNWASAFRRCYNLALNRYASGNRDAGTFFDEGDREFLAGIGATPMELYDFAEDAEELDWETALLIAAARRDFFLVEQQGRPAMETITMDELPPKSEELAGIAWLPRLIAKANARLRGTLAPDVMYCCGGDRKFLREHDLNPADFLRFVWSAKGDPDAVLEYVTSRRGS